jgi:hypothetical protein
VLINQQKVVLPVVIKAFRFEKQKAESQHNTRDARFAGCRKLKLRIKN